MPTSLVIRTAGTNCDAEMCRAFQLAGAPPTLIHLDALIREPQRIQDFDLIGFPGGFSYGDDVASGRIFAMRLRERLYPALRAAVVAGVPVIGACNGFQVLVQVGLLPGPSAGENWPESVAPTQEVTLSYNVSGRFIDTWLGVIPDPSSICVWTRGLDDEFGAHDSERAQRIMQLPIAHGEGRFVTAGPGILSRLHRAGQIALRYRDNINGSEDAVAGICDATGRVFGLMPHPERYLDWTNHPFWTRLDPTDRKGSITPGLRIFINAVDAAKAGPSPRPRMQHANSFVVSDCLETPPPRGRG
jgi:phosphoribosylformylglycinamidine synthase subunit PurQ / glutaminase